MCVSHCTSYHRYIIVSLIDLPVALLLPVRDGAARRLGIAEAGVRVGGKAADVVHAHDLAHRRRRGAQRRRRGREPRRPLRNRRHRMACVVCVCFDDALSTLQLSRVSL